MECDEKTKKVLSTTKEKSFKFGGVFNWERS
jgi:hypothetical protein